MENINLEGKCGSCRWAKKTVENCIMCSNAKIHERAARRGHKVMGKRRSAAACQQYRPMRCVLCRHYDGPIYGAEKQKCKLMHRWLGEAEALDGCIEYERRITKRRKQ